MVGYLRGFTELQTIYAISDLHNNFLLFLLRSVSDLGMVRDSKRRAVHRVERGTAHARGKPGEAALGANTVR